MLRPKIENMPHQWPAVYIQINFCVKLLCHLFKFHSKLFPSFQIKINFIILPSCNVLNCIGSNRLRITPLYGNQMCDRPHVRDVGISSHNVPNNNFCDAGCRQGGQAL